MKWLKTTLMILGIALITSCHAVSKTPPTQVVYRFDDHRYLELKGFNCEGGLRYVDTQRNIQHQIYDVSDSYQIFTKQFIHPSERYIVIPGYEDTSGYIISKDYGKTWEGARFSPGGGADPSGVRIPERTDKRGDFVPAGEDTSPLYEEIISLTVVNDQGFLLTKWGDIYLSSKPFDDPRLQPGGSGIDYSYVNPRGQETKVHMRPGFGGGKWGTEYASWNSFAGPNHWLTDAYRENFQNIPNKVPEVKNYTGWDHMRCDPDLGLPPSEQGR